jgi:hypothetical protein
MANGVDPTGAQWIQATRINPLLDFSATEAEI